MLIYAYMRASTDDQDAHRAEAALRGFVKTHGEPKARIAHLFVENASGASLQRPALFEALTACEAGDVLLVEQVDRLTRLTEDDWLKLRRLIDEKGIRLVSLDVPTSHVLLKAGGALAGIVAALNRFLFDVLAVTARKDYEDRRRRAAEGIARAKEKDASKFGGKKRDEQKHADIQKALARGDSWTDVQRIHGASRSTVARIAREMREGGAKAD
jgi:DNA invertase Pin-like site-specific DNA recombinase